MNRAIALVLTAFLVAGCTSGTAPTPGVDASPARPSGPPVEPTVAPAGDIELVAVDVPRLATTPDDGTRAGDAVNAFGLGLYRRLAADEPDANLVLSPASIALALSMARAGARGETAAEMDRVLRDLGADGNAAWVAALDASFDAANQQVTVNGQALDVILRSVNAPFAQQGFGLEPAYVQALGERFAAGLRLLDYAGDAEGSRQAINGWVSEQTEERIPELVEPGVIDGSTRLVLVNAIYLKAPWAFPFNEGGTVPAPFTTPDGSTMDVPMMMRTTRTPYAAGDGWQAAELAYAGDHLSMLVILPEDLAAFEAGLDEAQLGGILAGLDERQVELRMPSFGIDWKQSLVAPLRALGMPLAFTGGADFSGMTSEASLFISDVVHQANIDVDEKGTEAAAATAVVMAESSAPGVDVRLTLDKPFLFALRDTATGAVLFLGRVTEPGAADATY